MKPASQARILLGAFVLLALASSMHAQDREPPTTPNSRDKIESIVIRGNQRIPAGEIRKMIPIKLGEVYDPAKIEAIAVALRRSGKFDDVWTKVSDEPDGERGGTVVIFEIHEKQTPK